MRHSVIAAVVIAAANDAYNHHRSSDASTAEHAAYSGLALWPLTTLYEYARDRAFPSPETLARKVGEITGQPFPWSSLDDAPEGIRVFFITFRAVAEALEALHEPDPEATNGDETEPAPALVKPADALPASDAGDAAGPSVGEQAQGEDTAVADPISTAGAPTGDQPVPAVDEQPADPTPDQVDEIEEKRAELQSQTDQVIAESGGTFSEPKKKTK